MKLMVLSKRLLFFISLTFILSTGVGATSTWNKEIDQFVSEIVSSELRDKKIYVTKIFDASQSPIYLPFTNQIYNRLISSLRKGGARVTSNLPSAKLYLNVSFYYSLEGLSLQGSVVDQEGLEVSSGSTMLMANTLPKAWNKRTLKNIAYEISGYIDEKIAGQRFNTILSGLSGGESKSEDFISDFTVVMNRYMIEELDNLPSILIKKGSDNFQRLYVLKGKFRVNGNKIHLSYILSKKSDGAIVATASTEFTMESIPQGMSIYPNNKSIVKSTFDGIDTSLREKIPVDVWVNHENSVYRDGDHLEVSVRSNVDAYIRAFYVMSDGVICQIQPTSPKDSGLLMAGVVYTIGSKDDDVELIITDDTTGQESIKVFASLTPIEERFLPTKYIEGVDYACMNGEYKRLKSEMTRGLKMKQSIHPVNEIKILVK
jgi:hypothetical protein